MRYGVMKVRYRGKDIQFIKEENLVMVSDDINNYDFTFKVKRPELIKSEGHLIRMVKKRMML